MLRLQMMRLIIVIIINLFLMLKNVDANECDLTNNSVVIPDYIPKIQDQSIMKIYNTTVSLKPVFNGAQFNKDTFLDAALSYYADIAKTKLAGFRRLPRYPINKTTNGNNILVSYFVEYDLTELMLTPGINDNLIQSTIGNYSEVSYYIGSVENYFSNFFLFTGKDDFQFKGFSKCDQINCGLFMTCVENEDAVSLCCKSICKSDFCQNEGICFHRNQNIRPSCQCLAIPKGSYSLWYYGEFCESVMTQWMIILAVVLSVSAIIIVLILSCCCYCLEYKKREKEMKLQLHIDFQSSANEGYTYSDYDDTSISDSFSKTSSENKHVYVNWNPEIAQYYDSRNAKSISSSSSSSSSSEKNEDGKESLDSWSLKNEKADDQSLKDFEENPEVQETAVKTLRDSNEEVDITLRPGWTPSIGPQLLDKKKPAGNYKDSFI